MLLLGGRRFGLDDESLDWNSFFEFLLHDGSLFKLFGREVSVGREEWRVCVIA
jgi:hypothetical protein